MAMLADFGAAHPETLLARDAAVSYANALLSEGRASEAADLLEKNRLPARSDLEFTLGRAYAALGQNPKAAAAFANVYFNMPTSAEADPAHAELEKIPWCWPRLRRSTRRGLSC